MTAAAVLRFPQSILARPGNFVAVVADTCVLAAGFALFDAGLHPALLKWLTIGSSCWQARPVAMLLECHISEISGVTDAHFKEIIMAAQEISLSGSQSKLLNRFEVADGTMAFHFEKPPGFDFKPGQSSDLTLLDPPENDSEGNVRTFSIASAPFEDRLMFATRMRDTAFKRSLKRVPLGSPVKIDAPTGSFTLHKNSAKPAAFLTGGIGITPFLSIVQQAVHDRLPHKLFLFYSNRRPEDAPFLDILENLEKTNRSFRFAGTMTEMMHSKREWHGEIGLIDKTMLSRYLSDLREPIYYISGPPAMVTDMRRMLVASSIDEDDIRTDEFAGY